LAVPTRGSFCDLSFTVRETVAVGLAGVCLVGAVVVVVVVVVVPIFGVGTGSDAIVDGFEAGVGAGGVEESGSG
jgi:hypothetical protein